MILKAKDVDINGEYYALDRESGVIENCTCVEKGGATAILKGQYIGKFMTSDVKPYKKGEPIVPYDETNCFLRTAHPTQEDAEQTLAAYKAKNRNAKTNEAALRMSDALEKQKTADNEFGHG